MNNALEPRLQLPPINPYDAKMLSDSITYIGAAGFEDRVFAFLNRFINEGVKIENAIGITYLPYDSRNREDEFKEKLLKLTSSISWIVFNRHDPQPFQTTVQDLLKSIRSKSIVIDISAMSKFLIMILLQSLREHDKELVIAYAEPEMYHPTPEEFEKAKEKIVGPPDFLTSDVFRILHVTSLSSSSMQGHPILLVAYPTFNHNEIVALQSELSPNCMVLIFGLPPKKKNKWRLEALKEINDKVIDPDYCRATPTLSTFDYILNLEGLEKIYQTYQYTHRILLSPTGSKLQTVACFMFKQIRPDVQVIYPVTKSFIGEYSEGCEDLWCISIPSFSGLISRLDKYRRFH
jgi:hypothetical protein